MAQLLLVSRSMALSLRLADAHDVEEYPTEDLDALAPDPDVDVVVLDVAEPAIAVRTIDDLRSRGVLTPVLVVSGYQADWAGLLSMSAPDVYVVPLPITRAALLEGIDRLTGTDEAPEEAPDSGAEEPTGPSRRDRVAGPEPEPAPAPDGPPAADSSVEPAAAPRPVATQGTSTPVPPRPLEPWTPPSGLDPGSAPGQPADPAATPEQRSAPPGPRRPAVGEPPPSPPRAPRHPAEPKRFTISRRAPTRPGGRSSDPPTGPVERRGSIPGVKPVDPLFGEDYDPFFATRPSGFESLLTGGPPPPDRPGVADLVHELIARAAELFGVTDTGQVLADEIVERADADAAAVLVPDGRLWRVCAGVGLRPLERRLVLDDTHWLIAECALDGRALLIEDTDIVRQKLAGAPLASWRHLMSLPIPDLRSVVIVARGPDAGPFSERDLAAVIDPVREAAGLLERALDVRELARLLAPMRDSENERRSR